MKILPPETTTATASQTAPTGYSERQDLVQAARKLENTPWPEVTEASLANRMVSVLFGREDVAEGTSREDALEVYVASLSAAPSSAPSTLMRHADNTLRAARTVAERGRLAATAINPSTDDIAVLEEAIGDVRASRDMYIAALKQLKSDGHMIPDGDVAELQAAFSQTIRDIGSTADLVAERSMAKHQTSELAASETTAQ
ncbi:hypothetical protein [Aquisalinus flavus]|uniref:Uncharacterized protein n=1 Tax=Aquisalinus flavus TaxID=1526572 RepID=A0A8J2Y4S5_9PROT|nr:hypothetical protein [Aquisalinus flavus]MBD0427502.1 hypothetical protein [Aquisalinus flavus]UNE47297.1 hypothetical protein FF099_04100 [Aquisalinus flavus]GGD01493.1 hypothetical protein GCM10011342_08150 [Aquisalinus flavus]